MSMSVGSETGSDDVMVEMNTTPLIDVMLVLLVMLIVTIPIQTHAVKLDLPINNTPPPQDVMPEVINLEIDFDGTPIWNGTPVPSAVLPLPSRLTSTVIVVSAVLRSTLAARAGCVGVPGAFMFV